MDTSHLTALNQEPQNRNQKPETATFSKRVIRYICVYKPIFESIFKL